MKKISTILLIIAFVTNAIGQITLDHTFIGDVSLVNTHLKTVYYKGPVNDNQFEFYNEDYSFHKAVTVTPPEGCETYLLLHLSDKLFNNDELLEFTCIFYDTINGTGSYMKLINENGTELFDFGNVASYGQVMLTKSNGVKFLVDQYVNYPTEMETKVFSLPGSLTATEPINLEAEQVLPYPNPASSHIFLKYSIGQTEKVDLQIYNSSGQLIDTKKIAGAFNKIKLNVSNYAPGLYYYRYNARTHPFIVK
ncbi:T9SS type A sorting domain-containing protein [Salinivirga cyanobacteriivorans]